MVNSADLIAGKPRMAYLDALRGFSMILVMFGHVIFHSFGLHGNASFMNMMISYFRMPVFFFISGFVAYKALDRWNLEFLKSITLRKFQAQIVGTLFFAGLLYLVIPHSHAIKAWEFNVGAYWFTTTLFRIFFIYVILTLLLRRLGEIAIICLMVAISVGGTYLYIEQPWKGLWIDILNYRTLYYFQFFTLGVIIRKYGVECVSKFLTGNWFGFWLLLFCGLSLVIYRWLPQINNFSKEAGFWLVNEIVRYAGLFMAFGFFYMLREKFEGTGKLMKGMKYIGRRTLDLYFLHYFFLPDLTKWGGWMKTGNEVVPQLLIGGMVTAGVLACCLGCSWVLRKSSFLRQWLFGVKSITHN
ncbi:MAG: acyltransferase [Muribaculaceae bacterium]|nr:acyltransferase [Muribaculaceae bacterium]